MEKRSGSMLRRLIHRDSLPQLSFGAGHVKETKTRRKSEGMLTVPEHIVEQATSPSWYLKEIRTRDAAEEILNKHQVGTFLVRHSETSKSPGSYTLSLLHKDKCRHHKIETNPRNNKLIIKGYENHQFEDLEKLVEFFVKTQRKDIIMKPYNPHAVDEEDGRDNMEGHGPLAAYEEMDGSECQDEYQEMDTSNDLVRQQMKLGFVQSPGAPPPLPTRRDGLPSAQPSSYMNLGPRNTPPPPIPTQSSQGYMNIPPKGLSPPPLPPSPMDAPPLPPRVTNAGPGSYENIPARPPPLPTTYENHGTHPKYENYFPKQAQSTPGHSYQNLPPKITPRKPGKMYYSAEQSLPPRKPAAALRRTQTDTATDWQRRGYNM